MKLEGSCHCGAIKFRVNSPHPYPFNVCYCSICRKTAGGGGSAINIGAIYDSLKVEGEENISVYRAVMKNKDGSETESEGRRHFCKICASALWLWDSRWPELVHPFASAIDTELPPPPERNHMMVDHKKSWDQTGVGPKDQTFSQYPDESLASWHERHELVSHV